MRNAGVLVVIQSGSQMESWKIMKEQYDMIDHIS